MKKEDIQEIMWQQHKSGLLITQKHDPYKIGQVVIPNGWSVISYEITDNAFRFIDVGIDKIIKYNNPIYVKTPDLYEIIPSYEYSTPSSGVTSTYLITAAYDRIIAVNGFYKGLHIYGDYANNIYRRLAENKLKYKIELK